jgi:hypothetical protein
MAKAIERKDLKAEQAYFDQKADMFFWTPDGVGGFWYATLEELEEEHGEEGDLIIVSEILDY